MSLVHESIAQTALQYQIGDVKPVGYDISFTLHAIVEPTNDLGWLLLNGASLSTTTYAVLFAKYGYTFGGSGASFSLPDFTDGKILLPKGISNFTTFAATGGEVNHTLTSGEMAAHNHNDTFGASVSSHSHSGSGSINAVTDTHQHLGSVSIVAGAAITGTQLPEQLYTTAANDTSTASTHVHGLSASLNSTNSGNLSVSISIGATSSGTSHSNMSPYQVCGGWLVRYR